MKTTMKKIVFSILVAAFVLPAQAQLNSNEALGGAVLGGLLGGVIGHNNNRKTAEGAAIGAGAGLLLGTIAGQERRNQGYYNTQVPVPSYPAYQSSSLYYPPSYSQPIQQHGGLFSRNVSGRPNYAITGAALGGIAGGVIGHNNNRKTAEGAAIGAAAGLLLGGVAEQDARRREASTYFSPRIYQTPVVTQPVVTQQAAYPSATVFAPGTQATSQQQPTSVTIINNYYSGSTHEGGANSLFGR